MRVKRIWIIISFTIYAIFCFSCKQKKDATTHNGITIKDKESNKIKILGELEKRFPTSYNQADYDSSGCFDWTITKNQVEKVFSDMKLHDNSIISYLKICYYLPCHYYVGEAMYKGEKYSIKINAASYIVLSNESKKNPLFFILEKDSKYFLMACNCCEDD